MDSKDQKNGERFSAEEALNYHQKDRPGKIAIQATKPISTARDLSLAYTPGVAAPVRAIAKDAARVYDYTSRGNMVAVISNGSAILGLGNLGPLAAKPVMEGKAILFKRFAGIDALDIEVSAPDAESFIESVRYLEPSFGGINLEDIAAPDCFIIEERLRELMDIPVFHDDQHGTAIIVAAGLINALHLTGRRFEDVRIVVNGAGAAGIACLELLKSMGIRADHAILCDRKGPITTARGDKLNQWKSAHVSSAKVASLADALKDADVFLGVSAKGTLTPKMVASMADKPIIFALANPDPEITPEEVREVRQDAIVATGRSDYPNQINNVLGFPYIFRGALDVRARQINDAMKIACAHALAGLAREDVPDEVAAAYDGKRPHFGEDYLIPAPFDPRLMHRIPPAVATAAMESGTAQMPIVDIQDYQDRLSAMHNPVVAAFQNIYAQVRRQPKTILFAEGEEEEVIRAALIFREQALGEPILIGREEEIKAKMVEMGLSDKDCPTVDTGTASPRLEDYAEFLYKRLQRRGFLLRDCLRLVRADRNIFSACKLALGEADGMVTGITRNYAAALRDVRLVIDQREGRQLAGVSLVLTQTGRTFLVADTAVHDMPRADVIADIAVESARVARRLGYEPRVAFLAHSTFGYPEGERSTQMREAVEILDKRQVDFEYEGEMGADIALNPEIMSAYPFCRLSGAANVLIMPAIHSANISTKMLQELGGCSVIGPILVGLTHSVQILQIGAPVSDLMNMSTLAAYDPDR